MIATKKRFTELASTKGRVDTDAGMVYGVKLLGRSSKNGREYSEQAMRNAVPLYDGKKVYLNHPESSQLGEDRKFQDWVGVIESPRYESGAIFGNIRLRKASSHYAEVIEAAADFGTSFGMSHVADGESHMDRGTEIVEAITDVYSVDLVTNPATTGGLFESVQGSASDPCETVIDSLRALGVDEESLGRLADAFANLQPQLMEVSPDDKPDFILGNGHPAYESLRPVVPSCINASTFDSAAKFATRYR